MRLSRIVRNPFVVASAALYAPFIGLAVAMSLFASCSHCGRASWMVLPGGPGTLIASMILPMTLLNTSTRRIAIGVVVSVLLTFIIARRISKSPGARPWIVATAFLFSAADAWMMSRLIQA